MSPKVDRAETIYQLTNQIKVQKYSIDLMEWPNQKKRNSKL